MDFTSIKTEIKDRLGYTSTTADTRVGRLVNKIYREVGTSIGLDFSRQTNTSEVVTVGNANVTFSETEKILQVWRLDGSGNPVVLDQVLLAELRDAVIPKNDKPTAWALVSTTSNGVTVRLSAEPATAYTLQADVIAEVSDLSGTMEPAFPESFHDILIEGVLKDEYRKLEKVQLARDSEATFQRRLSDLRMFVAKSAYLDIQQGKVQDIKAGTSGGGQASLGSTVLTITSLWTFDRDPSAPFAVTDLSAYVPNLFTEGVGNVTTDRLIGRDAAGTGESEQVAVANGLEFTGLTSIGIANDGVTFARMQNIATDRLIGRDTAASGDPEEVSVANGLEFTGSTSIGIANDGVTYARMQNVSAASRVLGRGSAGGAGDPEELTVDASLTFSGTAINVNVENENMIVALEVFS